jgi:hypothetical protein
MRSSKMKTFVPWTGLYGSYVGENVPAESWKEFMREYCKAYVSYFPEEFYDYCDFKPQLKFLEVYSPREYNFENDRILAEIPIEDVERLFEEISETELSNTTKGLFTSYSGFVSFYDPDWREWPSDLSQWDENQVYALLLAFIEGGGISEYEFEQRVHEYGNLYTVEDMYSEYEEEEQWT